MKKLAAIVACVGALGAVDTPASAGAAPHCTATIADRVARADAVVIAQAQERTRQHGEELRTRFTVRSVVRGNVPRIITVEDCASWKCTGARFGAGEGWLLLLQHQPNTTRFELPGISCTGGDNVSAVRYDPVNPRVLAVIAAARP